MTSSIKIHPDSPYELPHRIALVHEWFNSRSTGGAEQVVKSIDESLQSLDRLPDIATLVDGVSKNPNHWLYGRSVQTSAIQHLPWGIRNVQQYLPLLPIAIEQLNVDSYPLVISSNHLVAKGVLTSPDQLHISYIHTPVRYAWDQMNIYLQRSSLSRLGLGPLIRVQLHLLRQWDQLSSKRVDEFFANSRFTARRIYKYWGRQSQVIHPPVKVQQFRWNLTRNEQYLCVCRLVPNKRVDVVIQAFNQLKLPLIIVGDGPEKYSLKKLAGPTVQILGYQSQEKIANLMGTCRAFVYAGIEDFGIAPVEAMASGAPVIALGRGGLLDTVRCASRGTSSPTGILFKDQNVSSLVSAISWFEERRLWKKLSQEEIRLWANRFCPEAFETRFKQLLNKAWEKHQKACAVASSDPEEALNRL